MNLTNRDGVSFAPNGDLWVADHVNHRVQIFDGNGTYLRQIGNLAENPGLYWPKAVAMDLKQLLFERHRKQPGGGDEPGRWFLCPNYCT